MTNVGFDEPKEKASPYWWSWDPAISDGGLMMPLGLDEPSHIRICVSCCDMFDKRGPFSVGHLADYTHAVMALTPRHTFEIQTRSPVGLRNYMEKDFGFFAPSHSREEALTAVSERVARHFEYKTPPGHLNKPWGNAVGLPWPLPNVTYVEVKDDA